MTQKEFMNSENSDRTVLSYGYDIFTQFKTPERKYRLWSRFMYMKHRNREWGGVFAYSPYIKEEMLVDIKKAHKRNISLGNRFNEDSENYPESIDIRKCFHLLHQLETAEDFWLYHEIELDNLTNCFEYRYRKDDDKKYKNEENIKLSKLDSIKVQIGGNKSDPEKELINRNTIFSIQNEVGVKGFWDDLFYLTYYRHKNIDIRRFYNESNDDVSKDYKRKIIGEHYIGINARYDFDPLKPAINYTNFATEYLFGGLYKANLGYQNEYFDISCGHTKYKASMLSQEYHGYHRNWKNNFENPSATQLQGGVSFKGFWGEIRPNIGLTWIRNPIYFEQLKGDDVEKNYVEQLPAVYNSAPQKDVLYQIAKQNPCPISKPVQLKNKAVCMGTFGAEIDIIIWGPLRWDNDVIIASELGTKTNIFRVPTLLLNSKFYYVKESKDGNAAMELGTDWHLKTTYKADAYDPYIQQFYLQDVFKVYTYPIVDIFLNFRIKRFGMFVKWSHLNEYIPDPPGYFVTPFYPGQKMALDIGIRWLFFD